MHELNSNNCYYKCDRKWHIYYYEVRKQIEWRWFEWFQ